MNTPSHSPAGKNLVVFQSTEESLFQTSLTLQELVANGDEVLFVPQNHLLSVIHAHKTAIKEVILLTDPGGIFDENGDRSAFLTPFNLRRIIEDQHPTIRVEQEVKALVQTVLVGLEHVSKIVITNSADLKAELETPLGAGTLCMNIRGANFETANTPSLKETFEEVHQKNVANKTWLDRGEAEKEKLFQTHQFYNIEGTILGGLSLEPINEALTLIKCVWTQERWGGNRISQQMLMRLQEDSPEMNWVLFCNRANTKALESFRESSFQEFGVGHPHYEQVIQTEHGLTSIPMILER